MKPSQASILRNMYSGHLWPDEQVAAFCGAHDLFPTRTVACGLALQPLSLCQADLQAFRFSSGDARHDLYDYFAANRIAGMLVCRDDDVVFEQYALGLTPATRWVSMSMAKSVSSVLIGAAIHDGLIESVDAPVCEYLPQLEGSAYSGVSIRHLLSMTTGVAWDEEYTAPNSDRRAMLDLQIAQQPGAVTTYMSRLPQAHAPGSVWNYNTGETHLLGELVHAATGTWLADYLSKKIWVPLAMGHDAQWWLEAENQLEVAGSGLFATLRDFSRFGMFMLNDGVHNGKRILPEGWVSASGQGTRLTDGGGVAPYGYMWWPIYDTAGTQVGFSARGIFGQRLMIYPSERIVVTVLSARAKPKFAERFDDTEVINQLVAYLQGVVEK